MEKDLYSFSNKFTKEVERYHMMRSNFLNKRIDSEVLVGISWAAGLIKLRIIFEIISFLVATLMILNLNALLREVNELIKFVNFILKAIQWCLI